MNKNSTIWMILAVLVLFAVLFFYKDSSLRPPADRIACTEDAKICPDGTAVGRTGPNCEFAPCPSGQITKVVLNTIIPLEGSVGDSITLTGSGFVQTGNVIMFGIGYLYNPTLVNENTLEFEIPDGYELCAPGEKACPGAYPRIRIGEHEIKVINEYGESNTLILNVK
ncbi:IPT/TIG domain-containing protein [Patescibacteria group bacterium]